MKLSQAKEYLPFVQAAAEGKTIQWKHETGWIDFEEDCNFSDPAHEYRIKPEPKLRPWKPEEVPMLAWYKRKGEANEWMTLAGISSYGKGVRLSLGTGWVQAFEELEHSTDGGKTWQPCGVIEE